MGANAKIGLVCVLVLIITIAVVWDRQQAIEPPELAVISQMDPGSGTTLETGFPTATPAPFQAPETVLDIPFPPAPTGPNDGFRPIAPVTTQGPITPRTGSMDNPGWSTPVPAPVVPVASTPDTYKVEDGDSFWRIALKVYGDGSKWELIAKANEAVVSDPTLLREGMVLTIPPVPTRPTAAPRPAEVPVALTTPPILPEGGGRTYTVESGDSLFSIAAKIYGTGSRWKKIYEANREILPDPHRLKTGLVLRIPADHEER